MSTPQRTLHRRDDRRHSTLALSSRCFACRRRRQHSSPAVRSLRTRRQADRQHQLRHWRGHRQVRPCVCIRLPNDPPLSRRRAKDCSALPRRAVCFRILRRRGNRSTRQRRLQHPQASSSRTARRSLRKTSGSVLIVTRTPKSGHMPGVTTRVSRASTSRDRHR